MQKETIKNLLIIQKSKSIQTHLNTKLDNDHFLDAPAINENLNNTIENIYRELNEHLMKEKISQNQFNDLWQYTQDYCSYIQV